MTKGDYVLYVPFTDCNQELYQKGRVKSIQDDNHAFVVFHCNNTWAEYENYTAARCEISQLIQISSHSPEFDEFIDQIGTMGYIPLNTVPENIAMYLKLHYCIDNPTPEIFPNVYFKNVGKTKFHNDLFSYICHYGIIGCIPQQDFWCIQPFYHEDKDIFEQVYNFEDSYDEWLEGGCSCDACKSKNY